MKEEKLISTWAKALFLTQANKSEEEKQKIIKRLAQILKKRKKEYFLKRILKRFEKVFQRENKVELIFARNQNPDFLEKTKKRLRDIFGPGREIKMKIDEDIIGGFRIKTGNLLIKASLKDFLTDLKHLWRE